MCKPRGFVAHDESNEQVGSGKEAVACELSTLLAEILPLLCSRTTRSQMLRKGLNAERNV